MSPAATLRKSVLLVFALAVFAATAKANELWVAPASLADKSIADFAVARKKTHFGFGVPDNFTGFTKATVLLIGRKDQDISYDLTLSIAQNLGSARAFVTEIRDIPANVLKGQLLELDVSAIFGGAPALQAGTDYVSLSLDIDNPRTKHPRERKSGHEDERNEDYSRDTGTPRALVFGLRFQYEGPTGSQGPAGPTGPQGPTGPVGPEGPEGKLPAVMCPAGQALRGINANGTPDCFAVVLPPVQGLAIDIRKQAEGPDSRTFASGSAVPFVIVVTNTGVADLANVSVSDPVTPVCNNTIGGLAAGAAVTYTCTVPNVTTNLATVATVTGSRDGVTVTDSDPSNVEIQGLAIDIRKQAEGPDSRTFASGSAVPFVIVVTNTGAADLANVSVSDPVTPVCNITIGGLAAGAAVTYTCTVPNVTTNLATVATVTGSRDGVTVTDSDPSNVEIIGTP